MTEKQRTRFKHRLIDHLTELYRKVHEDLRVSMVRELYEQEEPRDPADEALRMLSRDTRMRLTEEEAHQAQLVEDALYRLKRGTFGTCSDCREAIELRRLQALPWAARCTECQETLDFDARDHSPTM